ncbi:MAG: PTS sugar transporter subunit IIA [Microcella sp.]|uniref:PTS sugar transporter subunit IIA n=1 Tax=Microcella sp. TaxID=1913979 RepID=UPI0024C5FE12|nr:PTS sugar transporter subunit IIA [Microcella sp.]UYN83573.1 MAG: PTS sugar transporter subunit IIA [Microcella sp.]
MTTTVLTTDRIVLNGSARTRDEAIAESARLLVEAGAVKAEYEAAMLERESLVSTFMGNGLAIPHGTNEAKEAIIASAMTVVRYDEPLDWDGNPVRVVAAIAGKDGGHMAVLSALALVFSDDSAVKQLLAAESPQQVLDLLGDVNDAA